MTKTSKLIATTAMIAALASPVVAGNVAPPVVEPDVFVEEDPGLSSWAIAGLALGALALFAVIDDDDDDATATTTN